MKVTCEVCDGTGKIQVDDIIVDCQHCSGRGWVEVPDPEDSDDN